MLKEKLIVHNGTEANNKQSCCVCICSRLDSERLTFIFELIQSIINQKRKADLILLVLSGYPYKKLEQRKNKLVKQLKKIKNIDKTNIAFLYSSKKGVSAARNIAADVVKQDILIFSDDDDIWAKDKLQLTCEVIENSNVPVLIRHGFHTLINGKSVKAREIYFNKVNLNIGLISNYYGGGSTIAANTSLFKNIRFNESLIFGEDWDFWLRADQAEIPIHTIKKSLVKYRYHNNRKTNSLLTNYKAELYIRRKITIQAINMIFFSSIGILKSSISLIITFAKNLMGVNRF